MTTYTVYFEFFGKKMKTKIQAENPIDAKMRIKDRIKFLKIEQDNDMPDFFKDIFNL